jgi:CTP synthase (UTP-ammonia lyase)
MKTDIQLIAEAYLGGGKPSQQPQGLQTTIDKYIEQFPEYESVLTAIKEVALDAAGNIDADSINQDDPNKEEEAKQLAFWLQS